MNRIRKPSGDGSGSSGRGGAGDGVGGGDDDVPGGDVWPPGPMRLRVVGGSAKVVPIPGPIRVTVHPWDRPVEVLLTCLTADQWESLSVGGDPGGYQFHPETGLYVRLEVRAIPD